MKNTIFTILQGMPYLAGILVLIFLEFGLENYVCEFTEPCVDLLCCFIVVICLLILIIVASAKLLEWIITR